VTNKFDYGSIQVTVECLSQILTISSGLFAGNMLGASVVTVPSILDSNDPLPVWRRFYKRGLIFAFSSIIPTTAAGITCFVKQGMGRENIGFLATSLLSFSILPFTVIMLKPINDRLLTMDRNEEVKTVKELVKRWGKIHWMRTIIGIIIFDIAVFKIGQS